jgi:hypothetical protein
LVSGNLSLPARLALFTLDPPPAGSDSAYFVGMSLPTGPPKGRALWGKGGGVIGSDLKNSFVCHREESRRDDLPAGRQAWRSY